MQKKLSVVRKFPLQAGRSLLGFALAPRVDADCCVLAVVAVDTSIPRDTNQMCHFCRKIGATGVLFFSCWFWLSLLMIALSNVGQSYSCRGCGIQSFCQSCQETSASSFSLPPGLSLNVPAHRCCVRGFSSGNFTDQHTPDHAQYVNALEKPKALLETGACGLCFGCGVVALPWCLSLPTNCSP